MLCVLKRAMGEDVCIPRDGFWALHVTCYIQYYYTCRWSWCLRATQKPACLADCSAMQRCVSYLQLPKQPASSVSVESLSIYTQHMRVTMREETPTCRQCSKRQGHSKKLCSCAHGSFLKCFNFWFHNSVMVVSSPVARDGQVMLG